MLTFTPRLPHRQTDFFHPSTLPTLYFREQSTVHTHPTAVVYMYGCTAVPKQYPTNSSKPPHVQRDSSTTHSIHNPVSGSPPSRTACTPAHQLKMFQLRLSLPAWSAPTCPIATRPQSPRLHLKWRFSSVRIAVPDLSASAMALAASPVTSAAPVARAPAPPAPLPARGLLLRHVHTSRLPRPYRREASCTRG